MSKYQIITKTAYEEKIQFIKELHDNSQAEDAWHLFKDTVLDYVTGDSLYIDKTKKVEKTTYGNGTTFLSDKQALVSHEHTRSLFEAWISDYHDTYDKYKNSFLCPYHGSKFIDDNDKKINLGDFATKVAGWLWHGKYTMHNDYLTDQFILRGVSISMGHTTPRRTVIVIRSTLSGCKCGLIWRPFTRDIGMRIATDPIIVEVIKNAS